MSEAKRSGQRLEASSAALLANHDGRGSATHVHTTHVLAGNAGELVLKQTAERATRASPEGPRRVEGLLQPPFRPLAQGCAWAPVLLAGWTQAPVWSPTVLSP